MSARPLAAPAATCRAVLLILLAWVWLSPAVAQVFAIDGGLALDAEPSEPSVHFESDATRAQAVWAQRGSIIAVGLEGTRRSSTRSIVMPGMASCDNVRHCVRYSRPRVAQVPGSDRLLVAAQLRYSVDRGFDHIGGGSFPLVIPYPMLEVVALDRDRRRLWRRELDPAASNPIIGPQRPSIAATRDSALLAWTDMRPADGLQQRLFVQRLSIDGELLGVPQPIPSPGAAWADHGGLAAGDTEFLLVYETDRELRAQRIHATTGALGIAERIASKRQADRHPSAQPVVAWSTAHRRYLVSWREGTRVRLVSLSASARPLHAPIDLPPPCSGFGCLFSSQVEGWPSLGFSANGDRVNVAYSARPVLDTSRLGQVAYSLPVASPLSVTPTSRWLVAPTEGPAEESSHAASSRGPLYAVFRSGARMYAKFHAE
jgi:hypothetical protein